MDLTTVKPATGNPSVAARKFVARKSLSPPPLSCWNAAATAVSLEDLSRRKRYLHADNVREQEEPEPHQQQPNLEQSGYQSRYASYADAEPDLKTDESHSH
ncbi:hypothetical protein Tco_0418370 [Tanacetum coccineum]